MTDTVDMSVLLRGEPRKARFTPDGREYEFPVDISIPEGMRFQDLTDRWQKALSAAAVGDQVEDDPTLLGESYDLIVTLARRLDPSIDDVEIGMAQVPLFFQSVYGTLDLKALVADAEAAAGPTKARRRAAGTTKTRSTKTAKRTPARRSGKS